MKKNYLRYLLFSLTLILMLLSACSTSASLSPTTVNPDSVPPSPNPCEVNTIILNTGYDQVTGQCYAVGQLDGYWKLVGYPEWAYNPQGQYAYNGGLTVPTPAWVIDPNQAWYHTTPVSQWISAYNIDDWNWNNYDNYPSLSGNITHTDHPESANTSPYSFQRCFCTLRGVEYITIDMTMWVDNAAAVYFDNTYIGGHLTDNNPVGYTQIHGANISGNYTVSPGTHRIRVDLRNLSGIAMGLNIQGTVTSHPAGSPLFLKDSCCNPCGSIIGRKINDLNGNGIDNNTSTNQSIEPGLPGWTIVAINTATGASNTTVTDAHGWYSFMDLPAGTYNIYEIVQTGWSQTGPSTGFYTVTLAAGQTVQCNFYNWECQTTPPCACQSWSPITITVGLQKTTTPILCGDTFTISALTGGTAITIHTSYICTSCPVSVTWVVTNTGNGSVVATGTNLPVIFTPQSKGFYKIDLHATCGNEVCETCTIYIDIQRFVQVK
jgi:hypothetical protein